MNTLNRQEVKNTKSNYAQLRKCNACEKRATRNSRLLGIAKRAGHWCVLATFQVATALSVLYVVSLGYITL